MGETTPEYQACETVYRTFNGITAKIYRSLGLLSQLDFTVADVAQATGYSESVVTTSLHELIDSALLLQAKDGTSYRLIDVAWRHAADTARSHEDRSRE